MPSFPRFGFCPKRTAFPYSVNGAGGRTMPVLILTRAIAERQSSGFDAGAMIMSPNLPHLRKSLPGCAPLLPGVLPVMPQSEFRCGPVLLDARAGRVSVDGSPGQAHLA